MVRALIERSPPSRVARLLRRLGAAAVPRSAGVRVSRAAHRAIVAGNAARARSDWPAAAAGYRAALARMPGLGHIWIQLGHALKEAGDAAGAEAAYAQAHALAPGEVEPLLRLAHLAIDAGARVPAARHLVALLALAPGHLEATAELVRLLPDRGREPALWREAILRLGLDPADVPAAAAAIAIPAGTLVVDVSDLLVYFGRRRLPTGIQRVQIEIVLAYLEPARAGDTRLCAYAGERGWIALPADLLGAVCRASLVGDDAADPAWAKQVLTLQVRAACAPAIRFARAGVLVNLGTSWADRSYLDSVARARDASGLTYIAFVYDLIPVRNPEWFVPTLVRDYRGWLDRLLRTADGYLAISASTRTDLIAAAAHAAAPLDLDAVRVVRIDGDMRVPAEAAVDAVAPAARLAARGLVDRGFVLMVSTIEPRKNHVGAFGAWLALVTALGEARVPPLVCVGGSGWLNDPVHAMLRQHPVLRRKVTLLAGIADPELALLYRSCRFTLYPSFYEGWGLPVSESLCHGRVPAVARTSSLPEAGGDFAVYFDPSDPADIAARITPLIADDAALAAAEARIRDGYRARAWATIADELAIAAHGIAARRHAAADASRAP